METLAQSAPDLSALQVLRPATGGMARHVAVLCEGMSERGIACWVAGPARLLEDAHISSLRVAVDAPIWGRADLRTDLQAVRVVAHAARAHDLVHGHGLRGAWIAAWAARWARVPLVVTAHNLPDGLGLVGRWALRFALGRAHTVLTVSDAVSDGLRRCGLRHGSVVVAPNGVPVRPELTADRIARRRSCLGLRADAFTIVAAGRLAREKGFDVLVAALPEVTKARPDTQVILCGEGPERMSLTGQVERLGLADRVRLAGFVGDLDAFLAVADVVVAPSRSEGQGLVALEAMACGVPVVAARVGGLPEVVTHGATGWLFEPGQPEALASALVEVAADLSRARAMGEAARTSVALRFATAPMLDRVAEVYREATKKPAGRGALQAP
jgi:glycosyltransferase involved in cell wall biosynthesis